MSYYPPYGQGDVIVTSPGAPLLTSLPIALVSQRPNRNWCWAACCVMVFDYFGVKNPDGTAISKCDLAQWAFSPANCCADPMSAACDNCCWPDSVYEYFEVDMPTSTFPPAALRTLTLAQIEREIISCKRPIEPYIVRNTASGGGSHVVVVSGVSSDGSVRVLDPWLGDSWVRLSELQDQGGTGNWVGTYYGFSPR